MTSDVAVGDEDHEPGAGVAPCDAEVWQPGVVAEGDLSGAVDAVAAHPVAVSIEAGIPTSAAPDGRFRLRRL